MLAGMGALAGFHGGGGSEGSSSSTGSFSVSASPVSVSKTQSSALARTVTTVNVVATPSGGIPPYTHSWVETAGDGSIGASAPASNITAFSAALSPGDSVSATFTDTVTDSNGATGTVDVGVALTLVDPTA